MYLPQLANEDNPLGIEFPHSSSTNNSDATQIVL